MSFLKLKCTLLTQNVSSLCWSPVFVSCFVPYVLRVFSLWSHEYSIILSAKTLINNNVMNCVKRILAIQEKNNGKYVFLSFKYRTKNWTFHIFSCMLLELHDGWFQKLKTEISALKPPLVKTRKNCNIPIEQNGLLVWTFKRINTSFLLCSG